MYIPSSHLYEHKPYCILNVHHIPHATMIFNSECKKCTLQNCVFSYIRAYMHIHTKGIITVTH